MNAKNSTRTRRWLSRVFSKGKVLALAAGLATTGITGVALAEKGFSSPGGVDPNTTSLGQGNQGLGGNYVPGIGGGGFVTGSSYEESILRGQGAKFAGGGAFFQGLGQGNYLTAQGTIALEQARALYLDNVTKHADVYWQRKAIHAQGRQMAQGQRATADDLVRLARAQAPSGLTVGQYDSATGSLLWPEALMTPEFAAEREAIETVVKRDGIGHRNVEALSERMVAGLKTKVRVLDADDYMAAKTFLTGLAVESSETPSRAEAIAKNQMISRTVAGR
jgi:hypothetical protein